MVQRHPHFPRNKIPLPVTVEAWLLVASIIGTIILVKTQVIAAFLAHVHSYDTIISFTCGFLFSSGVVTPPAIVAIMQSAEYVPMWKLVFVGAIGSVCGDLLLFRFVRSQLVEYILRISVHPRLMRIGRRIASGPFWWIGPLLGAAIIASPLPDEIGLLMMGLSTIRLIQFIPLAFVANIVGIYLIILTGQHFG